MSNPSTQKFWVIIPAAGIGSRMQASKPKQYLQIEHKTILEHTLLCFLEHPAFEKVFVGISEQDTYFEYYGLQKILGVESFYGGAERSETVLNGLEYISNLAKPDDWVWVHDAARPCLSKEEINVLIEMLGKHSSGLVLGVPISDTIKRIFYDSSANQLPEIKETVNRSFLWRAMTPQIFKYSDLRNALDYCRDNHLAITDEASAIEKNKMKALMVQGSEHNIKVTLPADLNKVQQYISQKQNKEKADKPENQPLTSGNNLMHFPRIGTGFDVHAFGDGEFIILGGVNIPYEKGLVAHSDGDVLLHAIMDAMLGALALGDIGKHFPDTDQKWQGANSRSLLKAVNELLINKGYKVGNIDSTIIAQSPKMSPHIQMMQANIAEDLELELDYIGVKATTTERLGFTGRKEGIACQASVILFPISSGSNL